MMISRRSVVIVLLMSLFVAGYTGNVTAQTNKKKKHTHKSRSKTDAPKKSAAATEEDNEEDTRVQETPAEYQLTRKERKELRRKEKHERKEREKRERRERKEKEALAKKEKHKKGKQKQPEVTEAPVVVARKWADIPYAPTQKKDHYRIEVLASLFLDELVKNGYASRDIPDKAQPGLAFFKGVQIAADSLKKAHFDIDIYIHDVASIMESADMLVRKNGMDSADLILGAVAPKDVPVLANYAKARHINFISAISSADGGTRDNQYFTMLQPSLKSHCEWIAEDIAEKHGRGIVLYRTYLQSDNSAYQYITDDTANRRMFVPVLCNTLPRKEDLARYIDTTKTVNVVATINDVNYADSLLRILKVSFPRVKFQVYGMPSWSNMASIAKAGNYPNMVINVPAPFSYEPTNATVQYVDRVYRKEYGGKPQEMVYRGYEAMFWYANLLHRYGNVFNKQYADDEIAPVNKFLVKPQWDKYGNVLYMENRRINVLRYENGSMTVVR